LGLVLCGCSTNRPIGLEKSTDDRDKSLQHDLASVLDDLGQYRESIELAKIVGETSNNASWLSNAALLLLETPDKSLQDPQLAVELSQRAVKLAPKKIYLNVLGVAYYRVGNWQAAIESLNQSIEFDNENSSFAYNAFFLAMAH
jgi:tetratricopeptide (TPR) repeat protein